MEGVGNLSLNLLSVEEPVFSKKKQKIQGNRRERIKQRKTTRFEKEENQKEREKPKKRKSSDQDNRDDNQEQLGNKGREETEGAKKRKGDVFVSSLFKKNPEVPPVQEIDVDILRENVFTGERFKDLPLHPFLVSNLEEKQGFAEMTEVQKRSIPVLLRKENALIRSQTGSGKTLAYAVPIIQDLQSAMVKVRRDDGPYALIILPTRELAMQTYDIFAKLLRTFVWIVPGCLMGGEKKKAEKSRLRKGVNILISTPGRLMDHINTTSVLSLARIRWLVIDEADRLLELGYEKDIAQIINALKSQTAVSPQTILLSATLTEGVERLSTITLNEAEYINISADTTNTEDTDVREPHCSMDSSTGAVSGGFSVPSQLKQYFLVIPCKLRLVCLAALILWKCKWMNPASKLVVFLSTQDSVEFHSRLFTQVLGSKRDVQKALKNIASFGENDVGDSDEESNTQDKKNTKNLKVFKLHGEMEQRERAKTFSEFVGASTGVLFCTDVAARGLNMSHVDWIVQYTSPGATVDYVHRVGRTARAGTQGQSLLFLMPHEIEYVEHLNRHKISLKQFKLSSLFKVLLDNLDQLPKRTSETSSGLDHPRTQEEAATFLQDRFEEHLLENKDMQGLASKGFQSYVRAYATYSREVKAIFKVGDLHLGHVAKSFALREAPTRVHDIAQKFAPQKSRSKWQKKAELPSKRPLSFKQATLSEFSSGIQLHKTSKIMAKPGGKFKAKKKTKKFKH